MDNIIDLGEWTVPTDWSQVTLKQFSEIERYYADKESGFDARDVIHILCNKTIDEVNMLPIQFSEKIMEKLLFLQEKPTEEKPSNSIEIDGEKYSINYMEKLKLGEYVAVDSLLKEDRFDYASFLAILCRKSGEVYDSRFEAEVFEERRKMFEGISIVKVLPVVNFFLSLYMVSQMHIQLSLEVEEVVNHIQQSIDSSPKIGAFRKRYLKWRVNRLRKSLNSSKNT